MKKHIDIPTENTLRHNGGCFSIRRQDGAKISLAVFHTMFDNYRFIVQNENMRKEDQDTWGDFT